MSEARPDAASAKTLTTTIAGALRRPWPLATMLLAGCAVPPAPDASEHVAAAPSLHEIRVGVEFVAPDARSDEDRRTGDERKPPALPRPPEGPEHHAGDEPRQVERGNALRPMTRREIAALPTAADRFTFRLLQSLVGQEGDRLPRELGWSFLQRQLGAVDRMADDPWSEDVHADVDEALQEIGPRLLRKPVRNALREMPVVRDVELWIEDFKINNVPTSGAWLDSRDEDRRRYGHVSLRFQADGSDPLSVTWALQGLRLGASRDTVRAGYSLPLGDGLWLGIGSTFDHVHDRYDAIAELKFDISARTRLLLTFGNQINTFPGATLEREARKDLDGGTGAMMYLETIF